MSNAGLSASSRLLLCIFFFSSIVHAEQRYSTQSYESCSLITSEYLTILQLADRGLDLDTLKTSLPSLSEPGAERLEALLTFAGREGIVEAHSAVHSEYARCAKGVFDQRGIPPANTREHRFHRCAGENKLRYEIGLAATLNAEISAVIDQVPAEYEETVATIFNTHRTNGTEGLFDTLASELKACLKRPG